ncbi:phosphopyruvate hydratase [Candidatus Falkowbacteria bacterium]|nr:phosphopyruvate hydratase [Candidatus Falkowbacteria bacterium]
MKIKKISGREILDSRGNPTVEAAVELVNGIKAKASVPSGASTGAHEALELRDGDKKRYLGRGVLKAVENVNTKIVQALVGKKIAEQRKIDEIMLALDGTPDKSNLGANAILAVSLACARAGALAHKQPLYQYLRHCFCLKEKSWKFPLATMNIINGGRHADNSLTVQEFMVVPQAVSFKKRVQIGAEVFHYLKKLLKDVGYQTLVGDEGGFAPNLKQNEEALDFIVKAIKAADYHPGKDAFCGVDLALSEYFDAKAGTYALNDKTGKNKISASEVIKTLGSWLEKYPIISLEDPLSEDDWQNWKKLTGLFGKKTTLIGDDLFVTNVERLKKGIKMKVANGILIKLNQIGTLSETIDAIEMAKNNNYKVSVSHRSGETADTFIADLTVAVNADFIKTGSLSRSERVEKYNRLMEIEEELCN